MNLISHLLWTYILIKIFILGNVSITPIFLIFVLIFTIIPDILETLPFLIYLIIQRKKYHLKNFKKIIRYIIDITHNKTKIYDKKFSWASKLSFYTHSYLIFIIILIIVYPLSKFIFLTFLIGTGFHLFLDLFSHTGFYSARPLYPLSNFKIKGLFTWYENKKLMNLNYFILCLLYLIVFIFLK